MATFQPAFQVLTPDLDFGQLGHFSAASRQLPVASVLVAARSGGGVQNQ
jgi:hypothetical protein